ncbi:hypothetical protein GCM10010400_04410 [Streptomyces aculeolatus]
MKAAWPVKSYVGFMGLLPMQVRGAARGRAGSGGVLGAGGRRRGVRQGMSRVLTARRSSIAR